MELEALKASWNKLDERLAATEIVNLRVVKEVIQQKTKSASRHTTASWVRTSTTSW